MLLPYYSIQYIEPTALHGGRHTKYEKVLSKQPDTFLRLKPNKLPTYHNYSREGRSFWGHQVHSQGSGFIGSHPLHILEITFFPLSSSSHLPPFLVLWAHMSQEASTTSPTTTFTNLPLAIISLALF